MASISVPEFKVILCGEYGVGKTSLFRRFTLDTFIDTSGYSNSQARQSTLGLDHASRKYELDGFKTIKIQLWDTGGLERVASMTNSYYKFADAALLVFSLNSLESFHFISQHLLEILSLAENAKIFLVGNKSDKSLHEVSDSDIEMFMEQFPKFEGLYKVSCKNNTGVKEMFNEIAEKLANTSYKSNLDALKLHNQESSYVNESSSSNISDFCCAK
ncbi:uncharacterized protein LOC128393307 [Panonychus citri]|uniref:uncharacterized protein LOC128393307 n=1 Tax=Panonychus citri TaxID=50023 RepID=UPI002307FD97|nr:uncharacterized protein LOC128393307 [Panonychus citri]